MPCIYYTYRSYKVVSIQAELSLISSGGDSGKKQPNPVLKSETAHCGYPELSPSTPCPSNCSFAQRQLSEQSHYNTSKHLASDFSFDVLANLQVHTCARMCRCLNTYNLVFSESKT